MSANKLKIIACISMLIDHMGLILFPDIEIFRIIGRMAMPLFAFFIGEGCLHTRNKLRYFLSVFILGALCQTGYLIYEYMSGVRDECYLNILITFSFSIILCSFYICLKDSLSGGNALTTAFNALFFFGALALTFAFISFIKTSKSTVGINIELDYNLPGILLPLSVVLFKDKKQKLLAFSTSLCIFTYVNYADFDNKLFCLFALLPIVLLYFYNGKRGSKKGKYLFYIFYPLHLVALNALSYVI